MQRWLEVFWGAKYYLLDIKIVAYMPVFIIDSVLLKVWNWECYNKVNDTYRMFSSVFTLILSSLAHMRILILNEEAELCAGRKDLFPSLNLVNHAI